MHRILITGCCGFIGSNFVRYMLEKYDYEIIGVDSLALHSNSIANIKDLGYPFSFNLLDITNYNGMKKLIEGVDMVINFAAHTHVDKSIQDNSAFIHSNIHGVDVICKLCVEHNTKLLQVSTDEVYGSNSPSSVFIESDPYNPRNPYAATKASAELIIKSYGSTFGLDYKITRGANTYGPRQYPEKIIPYFIKLCLQNIDLTLYGDGSCLRDYMYVDDHCAGIDAVMHYTGNDKIFNIGANNLLSGNDIALNIKKYFNNAQICYIKDRKGHDYCYNMDCSLLHGIGWQPQVNFDIGLKQTINWYVNESFYV